MHYQNRARIPGTLADVLAVATPVQRWSLLVPGYGWVRYHGPSDRGIIVQFNAWRGLVPVRWTAEQIVYADEGRIVYRHVRGPTSGLASEWRLVQVGDSVEITVRHDWQPAVPLIGGLLAALACRAWVAPLTDTALVGIAQVVRSGQAVALRRLNEAMSNEQ